jgi:hypothetical protein
MLNDYIYLLSRLPQKNQNWCAPIRAQAAEYACQAADILLRNIHRNITTENVSSLVSLAEKIKSAGIEASYEPPPEIGAEIAIQIATAALESPSVENLKNLLSLLKACRLFGSNQMLFYIQCPLIDIFTTAYISKLHLDSLAIIRELYDISDMVIENFSLKLEKMTTELSH